MPPMFSCELKLETYFVKSIYFIIHLDILSESFIFTEFLLNLSNSLQKFREINFLAVK